MASPHGSSRPPGLAARALLDQAAAAAARGDRGAAVRALERVLDHEPECPPALKGLADLALQMGDYSRSVTFGERALRLSPNDPGLLNDLANSLILADAPGKAIKHLRKALKLQPGLRLAQLNAVRAYRALDQADQALAVLDDAAAGARYDDVSIRCDIDLERGLTFAAIGRSREATALFRSVLSARPGDVRAVAGVATTHRAVAGDNDLAAAERALALPGLSGVHRAAAHRAAGKMLEDLERYDEAFTHYTLANEQSRVPFDMAAHERTVERAIELFSSARLSDATGGSHSAKPVFVVGLPRSGTTLVEQVLSSHHRITGLGEFGGIEATLRAAVGADFWSPAGLERAASLPKQQISRQSARYLGLVAERAPAAQHTIDKMPHNMLVLGWIAMLFPKARIVLCERHPLDVCVSCFTHHFSAAHAYSTDLAILGRYWLAYDRLMRHWRAVLPEPPIVVRYEEMIADIEGTARRVVGALGLPWDPACLDYRSNRRVVLTPSQAQVRQPLYASSIGRWKRFDRHLGPLIASLGPTVIDE